MKVISFYSDDLTKRGYSHLSATNKLDYIIDVMCKCGENVSLLSLSTISKTGKIIKPEVKTVNPSFSIFYQKCFPKRNIIEKIFHKIVDPYRTYKFLSKNIVDGDIIYLYHSTIYYKLLTKIIKRKKAILILEVEEIYGDVKLNKKMKKKEYDFFENASAYIFPTILLNGLVNKQNKPYAIAYGSYHLPLNVGAERFSDNKIHVVYSGTFDAIKGGAYIAVEAALYLNEKYHIHLLGFGTKAEVDSLLLKIDEVKKNTKCNISFDGMLSGDDYYLFLQKCDIGLSTQNPNLDYNKSSFPSKVLTYLSNGLRVVSSKNISTIQSTISDYVAFSEYDAQSIANAIKKINLSDDFDGKNIISDLDKKFTKDFKNLIVRLTK